MANYKYQNLKKGSLPTSDSYTHELWNDVLKLKRNDVFGKGFVCATDEIFKFVEQQLQYVCQCKQPCEEMDSFENITDFPRIKKDFRPLRASGKIKKRNLADEVRECLETSVPTNDRLEDRSDDPNEYECSTVDYENESPDEERQSLARFDVMKIGRAIGGRSQSWTLLLTKIPLPIYNDKPIEALYTKYLKTKVQSRLNQQPLQRNTKSLLLPSDRPKHVKNSSSNKTFYSAC